MLNRSYGDASWGWSLWSRISTQSYIMIKPDDVQGGLVGEIISRFEKKGFKLKGLKLFQCPKYLPEVFSTEGKGWGLRTLEYLPKGSFVCEYVGEIFTNMELYERNKRSRKNKRHTYPVYLDADWGSEQVLKDEDALCLDATYYGNVGRFIIHKLLKNLIMQLANNVIHQTHYDVLDVKEDASQEKICTSYRSALLSSHPDKLQKTNSDHNEPGVRFLETAWEILGDVKSRKLYDRELQVSRQDEVTADEVELEDLMVDASGDVVGALL